MPEIKIKIRDKRAGGTGTVICGNSDYTVAWDLDQEWTPYDTKTMRVNLADGTYQDVVFAGDTAALPTLSTPGWASVGLYAGDLHTSRAADLRGATVRHHAQRRSRQPHARRVRSADGAYQGPGRRTGRKGRDRPGWPARPARPARPRRCNRPAGTCGS